MKAKKEYALNIREVFRQINKGNLAYIDSLNDVELKDFSPYIIQRWLCGATTNNAYHVYMTNETVNPYISSLRKHPELLYKLMCASNSFDNTQYKFITKCTRKDSKAVKMLCDYYSYSPRQARDALAVLEKKDLVAIAESLGYSDEEIKGL